MSRHLTQLDLIVVASYLLLIFAAGMLLTRRASKSVDEFFIGGRHMPWWLIGVSMAATNFSIDTPVSLTYFIRTEGISGVWFFWASAISALLVAFLFARLWRRSGVMTDAEIIEKRYAGKPVPGNSCCPLLPGQARCGSFAGTGGVSMPGRSSQP